MPATVSVSAATICSVEHGLRFHRQPPVPNGKIASRQIFLGLFGATFYNNSRIMQSIIFNEAMKKIIPLVFLILPITSFADACANSGNVYGDLSCTNQALDKSKKELNLIYQKLYSATQYKNEFEQSQKAWLNYRDKQCNGYIAAEASQSQGAGSGLITKDCLATITKQRVDYLRTLLGK
ncbi:lysozyme inhibitor LprI family protein [Burkholderia cepacia]|nr:lysozyme inhibitor LprI family protein [Burkholderia cepacia]